MQIVIRIITEPIRNRIQPVPTQSYSTYHKAQHGRSSEPLDPPDARDMMDYLPFLHRHALATLWYKYTYIGPTNFRQLYSW